MKEACCVSYEIAKLLKKAGFNKFVEDYYDDHYELKTSFAIDYDNQVFIQMFNNDNVMEGCVTAPTYYEVIKWFETRKHIYINTIFSNKNGEMWSYNIQYDNDKILQNDTFSSREDALNNAFIKAVELV